MKLKILPFSVLLLGLIFPIISFSQTYTFNPSNVGCDGNWNTGACWDKSSSTGCYSSNTPPSTCPVNIFINSPVDKVGNLIFSGGNSSLTIGPLGRLNIAGNLNVNKGSTLTIQLNGGDINLNGELNLATGNGPNKATLIIDGTSNSGIFNAQKLDLGNPSDLLIKPNGNLIISGPTVFAANNISIVNEGFFRTKEVDVRGQGKVENLGSGVMVIDEDLKITGNASLTVEGNSEIEVGGNLTVAGTANLNVNDTGSVLVCGSGAIPNENTNNITVNRPFARLETGGCRILPIAWLYYNVRFQQNNRVAYLLWSTAKEWENSHFEVERSVDGIKSFAKIGQVAGAGWSDGISEYVFEDKQLPLVGGKLYYRIKQVDFSGSHSYSRTIMITVPKLEFAKGVWRPYPNPTTGDQFQISLLDAQEYKNEPLQIRMIANLASTPYHNAQNEQELSRLASDWLKKAPKGLVILEIRWGNKVEHLKVMKK